MLERILKKKGVDERVNNLTHLGLRDITNCENHKKQKYMQT